MMVIGLLLAQSGNALTLLIGYGVFIASSASRDECAALHYISRWFDRRRSTALARLGRGSSLLAAIWERRSLRQRRRKSVGATQGLALP
ncbi:MAG: hypothetical protein JO320_10030 [Alphaproteobacteria bacterium]|nr:hypothetical protein [Alphaproteobacteria bacterium]